MYMDLSIGAGGRDEVVVESLVRTLRGVAELFQWLAQTCIRIMSHTSLPL
jgi:hypothetical protein